MIQIQVHSRDPLAIHRHSWDNHYFSFIPVIVHLVLPSQTYNVFVLYCSCVSSRTASVLAYCLPAVLSGGDEAAHLTTPRYGTLPIAWQGE